MGEPASYLLVHHDDKEPKDIKNLEASCSPYMFKHVFLLFVQTLVPDLSVGETRLAASNTAGEQLMLQSGAGGQAAIRQDLSLLSTDLAEYRTQLEEGVTGLEACLVGWEHYEEAYAEFASWLNQTEGRLRREPEKQSTLEEKEDQLEQYQVRGKDSEGFMTWEFVAFSCFMTACCLPAHEAGR